MVDHGVRTRSALARPTNLFRLLVLQSCSVRKSNAKPKSCYAHETRIVFTKTRRGNKELVPVAQKIPKLTGLQHRQLVFRQWNCKAPFVPSFVSSGEVDAPRNQRANVISPSAYRESGTPRGQSSVRQPMSIQRYAHAWCCYCFRTQETKPYNSSAPQSSRIPAHRRSSQQEP